MPYIPKIDRTKPGKKHEVPSDPGQLNWRLTMLLRQQRLSGRLPFQILAIVREYIDQQCDEFDRLADYELYNEVLGVFDAARREHDRRKWWHKVDNDSLFDVAATLFYMGVVAPYEELKIAENGDITDDG